MVLSFVVTPFFIDNYYFNNYFLCILETILQLKLAIHLFIYLSKKIIYFNKKEKSHN